MADILLDSGCNLSETSAGGKGKGFPLPCQASIVESIIRFLSGYGCAPNGMCGASVLLDLHR